MRACLALFLICGVACADEKLPDDPDVEVARRYYEQGAQAYAKGNYEEAVALFEKSRAVKAAPALDYNIARAYDRLDKLEPALAAYRRYLATQPPDSEQVRERISVLERRAAQANAAAPAIQATTQVAAPAPKKKRTWVYAVAGVAAVAVIGVSLGVGLGVGLSSRTSDPSPPLGSIHW
jgi:iron complex outermembrane receptor protein